MKFTDLLWVLFIVGFMFWGVSGYFSIPVVYWSYSQDKCVKIVHDNVECDCSELPDKYERVWVK